jgi:hypothetical protein
MYRCTHSIYVRDLNPAGVTWIQIVIFSLLFSYIDLPQLFIIIFSFFFEIYYRLTLSVSLSKKKTKIRRRSPDMLEIASFFQKKGPRRKFSTSLSLIVIMWNYFCVYRQRWRSTADACGRTLNTRRWSSTTRRAARNWSWCCSTRPRWNIAIPNSFISPWRLAYANQVRT